MEHFKTNDNQHQVTNNSLVKNKSNFVPPKSDNRELNMVIKNITQFNELHQENHRKIDISNISTAERKALQHLKEDNTIIIKEADKGGATVIMDRTYYKGKILELLNDTKNYTELPNGNEDANIMKKINKLTKEHKQQLTNDEIDYINNFTYKTSNFYGLPKIHKSAAIKAAIKEQNAEYIKLDPPPDLKMRPIVAGPSSPTHRLSNFIDIILKPLCAKVPSYIRDDLDFLNYIPNEVSDETLLVSFDVVNLYTNIPHELGLEALEYWLDNYTTELVRPFSKEFILNAVSIVLKENTFKFDDQHYRQIQGTAMGTKMAPTYATLVMGHLERKLYEQFGHRYGTEQRDQFINIFKRYLDDCFLFWDKTRQELDELHKLLNDLHPKLQFTMEAHETQLPFLDILLCKDGKTIYTDIYYKRTDSHQYLDFNSCHPKHCKTNIPYTLARRICTIITNHNIREQRLEELETFLISRNYPTTLINASFEKAKGQSIEELRRPKTKENQDRILPLVITHNPNNPNVIGKVKETVKILNLSDELKDTMHKTKLIVTRRQPKNLKAILTQAEFSTSNATPTVTKCNEPRCGTCPHIITGNKITLKNGKMWTVRYNMSCKSREIIYIIICPKCDSFYVGTTENLRNRVTLHKQHIRHEEYRHLAVSEHLFKCSGGNFKIMPIYQCINANRLTREAKEKYFIRVLEPNLNAC